MNLQLVVFYLFSAILLLSSCRVISCKNTVHAALFLVLSFFTSACLWLLLQAEFLAITLVLVYVGAVMVLFLFVVMMLDVDFESLRHGFWRHFSLAILLTLIMAAELIIVFLSPASKLADYHAAVPLSAKDSNVHTLGLLIYTDYFWPFELSAVLLLIAIIVAIALTLRQKKERRQRVSVSDQIAVERKNCVRLVNLDRENPLLVDEANIKQITNQE